MAGNDALDGEAGDDTISGGAGNDTILGGFTVVFPAGEYLICAVPDEAAIDWQEASRLDALARTAQRVVVVDGTRTNVTVKR